MEVLEVWCRCGRVYQYSTEWEGQEFCCTECARPLKIQRMSWRPSKDDPGDSVFLSGKIAEFGKAASSRWKQFLGWMVGKAIENVELETRCEACDGRGDCAACGESGLVPSKLGKQILKLIKHNSRQC
jgi:hypothetical protein